MIPVKTWKTQSTLLSTIIASAALLLCLGACDSAEPDASSPQTKIKKKIKKATKGEKKAAAPAKQKAKKKVAEKPPAPVAPRFPSFADLVENSRPAVINIYTRTKQRNRRVNPFLPFVPPERVSESLGSGFIINKSGLALTNHHVIANATDIEVRLLDERRFKAKIIGEDPKTDTALIQIQGARDLPSLSLSDSDKIRVGEWVVAIGNPLGLTSTVTAGIVSARGRRNVPLGGELRYKDFIQTDASINPGNSGGPLLNVKGEVVGINTAINAEAQGIGFAIPSNMVKQILPQLKKHGRVQRSWLGIYIDNVPRGLRKRIGVKQGGALVTGVVQNGPAERAKIKPGDVITHIDNAEVKDASNLSWVAGHKSVGKVITVELRRGTQRMKTQLKLGALPD